MTSTLNIVLAQLNLSVGAVKLNTSKILQTIQAHPDDLIVFPELSITGYPPEDLLFRDDFLDRVTDSLAEVQAATKACGTAIVGHPWRQDGKLYNAASVFAEGQLVGRYFKQRLPNYGVFDEQRYFAAGNQALVVDILGTKVGVLICEDLWFSEPAGELAKFGAEVIVSLNASPFNESKHQDRVRHASNRATETGLPVVYVNHICGQDELIFDGCSFVLDGEGKLCHQSTGFVESTNKVNVNVLNPIVPPATDHLADIYDALVLSVKDYVNKNGFSGAVLGLSGGIDSALTLAVAVDALGAERVRAVMMPYTYTSTMSVEDATEQARIMGVEFDVISIEPMVSAFSQQLAPSLDKLPEPKGKDTTPENLQARARGVLLMALSNKSGRIVLTTGNKSEMAVGYCTLYGDMCGGFAVIKDIPKMMVYALSNYRNTRSQCIPERVITRPPSAELAPDQVDQDSLPPYEVLDDILERYIEQDQSKQQIIATGFDEQDVNRVLWLVDINEYKRRQSAIGPKITSRNFGKDRRYPITSGFRRES